METNVEFSAGDVTLHGDLTLPDGRTNGVVLFAHGSGSGRFSPRNRHVAQKLNDVGLASLLFDLLTAEEEVFDIQTRAYRFDIPLLAARLLAASDWLACQPEACELRQGYFGSSTGAAAALIAASERPSIARAVVSRGGRPDLAEAALEKVTAPTLLIVGSRDEIVIGLNCEAMSLMQPGVATLEIVEGATHLFEEPGALDEVARLAGAWFVKYLG